MNKILKGVLCAGACITLLGAAGCKEDKPQEKKWDSETRPLRLATAALDGNFNPFFYTSLNDGNMVGMTQISMLTTDAAGNLVCGQDWATVALDRKTTMYTTKDGNTVTESGSMDGRTEYEFVIKNGIKFSNGSDLTIKDVLFNLYVYLDPAYTGSMTLYSVDIQGLNAYRMQDPEALDGGLSDVDNKFRGDALSRINNLIRWSAGEVNTCNEDDLELVKKLFKEEITTDWTSMETSWYEGFKDSYRFKEDETWKAYLLNEGIITVQTRRNPNGSIVQMFEDKNGNNIKEDGELYYTTLDPWQQGADGYVEGKVEHQHLADEVAKHVSDNLASYKAEHNCDDATATAALQRDAAISIVYRNYTDKIQIQNILQYWATASEVLEEFVGQERTAYYDKLKEENKGELLVKTISGITTYKTSSFNGKDLGGQHDVLKIVINGVDPKAEYNFGFPVAPMYYYSGTYKNVDYVAKADGVNHFGVDLGNKDFYDSVVQAPKKNGVPMGAGAYQAASRNDGEEVTPTSFFQNNSNVFFIRNEYFKTVGTGLSNAKIKRITYSVRSDDKILDALKTGEIDYGEPNAIPNNQNEVEAQSHLSHKSYFTGGYGYIGINPKFVPEVGVRQALMKSMNTRSIISNYYSSALAKIIWRPQSTESWAYPDNCKEYDSVKYTSVDSDIIELVEDAGYRKGTDGIYAKGSKRLEFTFTIAGESANHPAYAMFQDSADRLNRLGFKITVSTAIDALRKLNSGSLEVWAAAYTTAADPDMYQLYHKDSRATAVNNWNYAGIYNDTQGIYGYERGIIDTLSTKIEQARETLVQSRRKAIYSECLDLVMDLAVALPTYQRKDLCVYNNTVIDAATLNQEPSSKMGLIAKIWEVDYI